MTRPRHLLAFALAAGLGLAGCNNGTEQQDTTGSGDGPTSGTGSTNDRDAPTEGADPAAGTTGTGSQ